ncbi:MAG: deoxynucleoside kinase [Deltaproteobacteria bacterium]|nr:deoxynucleoside kinase [Deltaproteobacteria bacterium]
MTTPILGESNRRRYIAVAGNIGAGKSTLVDFLCRNYDVQPFFEPSEDNPYLADFYDDMPRWAFHSQLFFLSHKFRIHLELNETPGTIIQDRTIFEDAEIFATALHKNGTMQERDWQTYHELYKTIVSSLKPPDLMIYLRCPMRALKKRIKLRGRAMEQDIPTSYLKLLHTLYEEWIENYKLSEVLVIDTEQLDYIQDLEHRLDVMQRIEAAIPEAQRKPTKP